MIIHKRKHNSECYIKFLTKDPPESLVGWSENFSLVSYICTFPSTTHSQLHHVSMFFLPPLHQTDTSSSPCAGLLGPTFYHLSNCFSLCNNLIWCTVRGHATPVGYRLLLWIPCTIWLCTDGKSWAMVTQLLILKGLCSSVAVYHLALYWPGCWFCSCLKCALVPSKWT